jgi:hypothetical protein
VFLLVDYTEIRVLSTKENQGVKKYGQNRSSKQEEHTSGVLKTVPIVLDN